jgi:hypothetical protein
MGAAVTPNSSPCRIWSRSSSCQASRPDHGGARPGAGAARAPDGGAGNTGQQQEHQQWEQQRVRGYCQPAEQQQGQLLQLLAAAAPPQHQQQLLSLKSQ